MGRVVRRGGFQSVDSRTLAHRHRVQFVGGAHAHAGTARGRDPLAVGGAFLAAAQGIQFLLAFPLRILQLLPTSTYLQMAEVLYISRNTVKTHLRSIYQKLGVASRSEAIERAIDLHLL